MADGFCCDWFGCPEVPAYEYSQGARKIPELAIRFCPKHRQTLLAIRTPKDDLYRTANRLVRMSIESVV